MGEVHGEYAAVEHGWVAGTLTWGQVQAMERSHQWGSPLRLGGGGQPPKTCQACGDGVNSVVRYCPGAQS